MVICFKKRVVLDVKYYESDEMMSITACIGWIDYPGSA